MASLNVHGNPVSYDDSSREGINYLFNLSYEAAKDIFEKAAVNGFIQFDYEGSGYKLVSDGGGMYSLSKRY